MTIGIVSSTAPAGSALQAAVTHHSRREVIWVATTADAAVERCSALAPDLLLVDLRLDGLDGIDLTRRIMAQAPCPILIVADSLHVKAAAVFEAMGVGALDAVETPEPCSAGSPGIAPLVAKIETIARLIRSDANRRTTRDLAPSETIVVFGASAGGPAALSAVLAALPGDLPAAVVIVQHVSERFMPGMLRWLDEQSQGRVTLAQQGERPTRGRVSMAGAAGHLRLTEDGRFSYTMEPHHSVYRPSVDVFFESVGRFWTGDAIGVLLTGMGRDGAAGLKSLRDRGHHTIAQNEATSAVYGMPKAAVALDAAVDVLPLSGIADRLVERLTGRFEPAAARR